MNGDGKRPDNDEKLPEREIEFNPESEKAKKLENFWYYNKWKVLGGSFAFVVLLICLFQFISQIATTGDMKVLYAGAYSSSSFKVLDMKDALTETEPESLGDKGVGLSVIEVYDNTKLPASVNASYNSSEYTNFKQLIFAGEYSLLFIDKWIYDDIKDDVGFRPVSEIYSGNLISDDAKNDGYSVVLKKTAFYEKYSEAFSGLPDDVVICLLIPSTLKSTFSCSGSGGSDKSYKNAETMFAAILGVTNEPDNQS